MGLFDLIFGRKHETPKITGGFETLTAYRPIFSTWGGQMFENELVRAAIDAKSRHVSKLKIEINDAPLVARRLRRPNSMQTWGQWLYRLNTILEVNSTAFIVPALGELGEVTELFTILPTRCELVQSNGKPWIRYTFTNGKIAACPLEEIGILTKYQYKDDFFGTDNKALNSTMQLISIQKQGIEEAVKSSASYRFIHTFRTFPNRQTLPRNANDSLRKT